MDVLLTLPIVIAVLILVVIGGVGWFIYMKIKYKTVPSNIALIITGPKLGDPEKETNIFQDDQGRSMKVIRGGGHRLRMFQTHTPVSLNAFQLKIETPKVYTQQGVGIFGEAVATVKVSDTLEGIVKYAEQFLGRESEEYKKDISEVLGSNLRAILSKMTVEQINSDRESFNEQVRQIAQSQLDDMGFRITSLGLTNLTDDENYLENLGRPKIAQVKKEAEIAESTNTRETKVHTAQMNEDVKKEEYERDIAIAESRKEKEIKDAQIKAETEREKARTEASYDLERAEREIEVERERLKIVSQEKEEEMRLQLFERERHVKLEEEEVKVRQAKAEAEYYEKVKAAEAEAESQEKAGRAEAEVIKMKSVAEVEAIEKRAEALNKHKEVMMTEMLIKMLPDFAKAVSEPLSNVESIRILDGGKGNGVESLPGSVTGMMTNLQESLAQMTGLDLNEIVNNLSGRKNLKGELGEIANTLNKDDGSHDHEISNEELANSTDGKPENEMNAEE
ncbi:flotillin [Virgibacillus natechei]|uniref:Flotillin n=1 Tax=Virgibacillus natechei TaxID=1216297 RepID=A0ABS4IBL4_9BACI|nr:SPFH domain-containing protein [Virgibacillus natechei]MBP1968320.1 flotillin [Virgibacillus natechei]UZD13455.1 SPFH domain-containing protein [Virgibacillus natechei]